MDKKLFKICQDIKSEGLIRFLHIFFQSICRTLVMTSHLCNMRHYSLSILMPNSDQVQIANYISYDKVTIGGVIERLQRKGLISRLVNERDKRARILNITNEGIHMISQVDAVIEQIQQDILKCLMRKNSKRSCSY